MWVITDGRQYITGNAKNQNTTGDIRLAKRFETSTKASNFMINMKRTYQSFNWSVSEVKNNTPTKNNKPIIEKVIPITYVPEKTIYEQDWFSWDTQMKNIELFFKQIVRYKEELEIKQAKVEREKVDFEHAIEFAKRANGSQKCILMGQYQDCLDRRRIIKDELFRINIIRESDLNDISTGKTASRLHGLDTRQYEPRERPELFKEKYIVM